MSEGTLHRPERPRIVGNARALFEFATDARKWRKVGLLVRERVRIARYRIGRGVRVVDSSAERSADRPESQWSYESDISIPASMIEREALPSVQDRHAGGGRLVTRFNYRMTEVAGGTMLTNTVNHRSIYDGSGRRLADFSYGVSPAPHDRLALPVTREVPGSAVSAYGNVAMAGGNYGHWLIDGLARLFLVQRDHELATLDHVVVPQVTHDFQREMLALFDVGPERTFELKALEAVRFSSLVCTTAPRGTGSSVCPGWVIDGFRTLAGEAYGHRDRVRGRRLYISRRDAPSRRFVNEAEIVEALEARGFETVELSTHDLAGKTGLFAEAECVVGLTGAGMVNTMFSPRGTTVLELIPRAMTHYLVASVCAHLDCKYVPMFIESGSALSEVNRHYGDMYINVPSLVEELAGLGF